VEVDGDEYLKKDISTPPSSDQQSPPRKRARITNTTSSTSTTSTNRESLSFDSFDALPIYARGVSEWNRHLKENSGFWVQKCSQWVTQLNEAYSEREVSFIKVFNIYSHFLEPRS
jgi:hypothetical protein